MIKTRVNLPIMNEKNYTAFAGFTRIATGTLEDVASSIKKRFDASADAIVDSVAETHTVGPSADRLLVFDDETGRQIDFDLSGTLEEVRAEARARVEALSRSRRGRGRPKLGVECGELCLLPRHWEWLSAQPRSASATIRRLIDAARKSETPEAKTRERIDAAGAFMWSIAGDLPGFEEASRALYRQDRQALYERIADWPEDVRRHVHRMLEGQ